MDEPYQAIDNLNPKNPIDPGWTHDNRKAVKISDAFAHLAVAEHDVVAVSTNRQPLMEEGQITLGIVACATPPNEPEPEEVTTSQAEPQPDVSEPTPSMVDKIFQHFHLKKKPATIQPERKPEPLTIIIAKNGRKADPTLTRPSLVKAIKPSNFDQFASLESYITHLVQNW